MNDLASRALNSWS